jgi:hypothetical protein
MDPVAIANLAALGIQIFSQIYSGIQKSHADALKPLADILLAANNIDDDIIATAKAEIAKLTAQPTV